MRKLFLFFVFLSGAALLAQSVDNNLWITDGGIYTSYYDASNSTLYIGGQFQYVGPNSGYFTKVDTINGNNPDLTIPKVNGTVYCIAQDGSGGWYVGGDFTKVGDSLRNNLVHITSSGTVDAWNPNANDAVITITVNGNDIYVGGYFTHIGGAWRNYLAKLNNTDGKADVSWDATAGGVITTSLIQGGYLYVGGQFDSIDGESTIKNFAKLNLSTADVDTSWHPNPDARVNTIVSDGTHLYVGGYFFNICGASRRYLAEINISDGTLVSGWNPDPNNIVEAIVYGGSYIYIGGWFTSVNSTYAMRLAKIETSTGNLASTWSAKANNTVHTLYLDDAKNHLYVGGDFNQLNDITCFALGRLRTSDGALETGWSPNVHKATSSDIPSPGQVYALD
jgi:hypothetical protein